MSDQVDAIPGVTVSLNELVRLRAAVQGLALTGSGRPFSPQAGVHRSAYRGRGLEFDEVRIYQSGDDVRNIDWRVTARRGKLHTKLFREERERPVLILVDLNPGMFFGTRLQFKSVLAARAASILAWVAAMGGDRVGGVVAGDSEIKALPPRPRQAGVLSLLYAVKNLQPHAPGEMVRGRLDAPLSILRDMAKAGSLVIMMSDFRELGPQGGRHIRSIAMRNDVTACLVYDALEKAAPPPGIYRFGTPQRKVTVDTAPRDIIQVWSQEFETHSRRLKEMTHGLSVRWLEFPTDVEAVRLVKAGFRTTRRAA